MRMEDRGPYGPKQRLLMPTQQIREIHVRQASAAEEPSDSDIGHADGNVDGHASDGIASDGTNSACSSAAVTCVSESESASSLSDAPADLFSAEDADAGEDAGVRLLVACKVNSLCSLTFRKCGLVAGLLRSPGSVKCFGQQLPIQVQGPLRLPSLSIPWLGIILILDLGILVQVHRNATSAFGVSQFASPRRQSDSDLGEFYQGLRLTLLEPKCDPRRAPQHGALFEGYFGWATESSCNKSVQTNRTQVHAKRPSKGRGKNCARVRAKSVQKVVQKSMQKSAPKSVQELR